MRKAGYNLSTCLPITVGHGMGAMGWIQPHVLLQKSLRKEHEHVNYSMAAFSLCVDAFQCAYRSGRGLLCLPRDSFPATWFVLSRKFAAHAFAFP